MFHQWLHSSSISEYGQHKRFIYSKCSVDIGPVHLLSDVKVIDIVERYEKVKKRRELLNQRSNTCKE